MKVVLLGSGNVATHLGNALKHAGHEILQVWSRTFENASKLAVNLNAVAISSFQEISSDADIYIISVTDDAITAVASQFTFRDKLLVHTSGTTSLDVLVSASTQTGVLYPLQTFSKQRPVNFKVIPLVLEASNDFVGNILQDLAESLSEKVLTLNSIQREALHVAAVFACNFSNYLYAVANQVLNANQLNFDLIRPLIAETAAKVQEFLPHEIQTGPAVRNDKLIINKHVKFLENNPDLQKLYAMLSQDIINFCQKP